MALPEMKDMHVATSRHALDAMEQRLRIQLPAEYREWLLKYNGGRPWPGNFHYKHETGPYTDGEVSWFFAVWDGKISNFELEYRFWKITTGRVAGHFVPIAHDAFGNLICLTFGGPDKGKIYFWDHEQETDPPSLANCHLVADNFDEFIDALAQPRKGAAEEEAAERKAIESGPFPASVERQCKLVEAKYPMLRQAIRGVSLSLFNSKHDFCFWDDPVSLTFLDLVFWLKSSTDGAAPIPAGKDDDWAVIEEWYSDKVGGFGLNGYAPGFVDDWLKDRVKNGLVVTKDHKLQFTPAGSAKVIDEMRRLVGEKE